MAFYKQSTAYTRMFKMIDSADHFSKKTGLTCTVNISKAGAAFGAAGGTVTEVANGWYKVALTTTDTNTVGDLAFYITATGADDTDFVDSVFARTLDDLAYPATSGRSIVVDAAGLVDANMVKAGPSGSGTAQTARDLGASVLLSSGTGTGQISLSSGAVLLQATQTGVTIPTVTNLTNAPTAGDLTATMKASVTTAATAATPAAASVTGSVGSIATGGITRASFAADTGMQSIRSNTAQAGAAGTLTLDASASSIADFYVNCLLVLTGGTGVGQARFVTAYNGTSKVATVNSNWKTTPDNTTIFAVMPFDAIPGATAPTAAQVATAVWQDLLAGSDFSTAASIGKLLKDDIDAAISSRLAPTTSGRTLDVTATGEAGIDWANIGSPTTSVNLSGTTISTSQAVASVSGAVGSVTGNVGGNVTGSIGSLATQAKADVNAEVDSALDTAIPGSPTANSINERIQTMDNAYTATRAGYLDNLSAGAVALDSTVAKASALSTLSTTVGTPAGASVSADIAAAKADTAAILDDTGTSGVVVAAASKTGMRLSATGVGDILTTALTESYASDGAAPTLSQAIFAIQQMMQEKSLSSTTMTVKKLDGTTTAMTFTLNDATTPTSITRAT